MNKKIIFQKCNFNYIYFLLYIIALLLNTFIEFYIYSDNLVLDESELYKYILPSQILNLYISNLSNFIAIIPYFIRKKYAKKEKKLSLLQTKIIKESKNKKMLIIIYSIIMTIFGFLSSLALILYNVIYPDKQIDIYSFTCTIPFEIILQFICSYFILKIKFYKLQYFSLFLNLCVFIIILIIDIINIALYDSFDGKIYIFYAFYIIFYSIEYSYGKKLLLDGYVYIFFLMIIKGLFTFILVLITSLIIFFVNKSIFSIIGIFLKSVIMLIIASLILKFFESLFFWLIIDKFSPNYYPFALIILEICYYIINTIFGLEYNKTMGWDIYFRIFLYLILFIGVMIHNEIVVINICNLGSDTKYFLELKLQNEELYINTDNPDIIKRYESFIEMKTKDDESSLMSESEN